MKIKHVELNIVSIEVMRHTVVELPATRRYKTGLDWTWLSWMRAKLAAAGLVNKVYVVAKTKTTSQQWPPYDRPKRTVFSRRRKTGKDCAAVTSWGRLIRTRATAIWNARSPSVRRRVAERLPNVHASVTRAARAWRGQTFTRIEQDWRQRLEHPADARKMQQEGRRTLQHHSPSARGPELRRGCEGETVKNSLRNNREYT